MMYFTGLPVYVNDMQVPVRMLKPKQWHGEGGRYAQRVQKKWAKRFGQRPMIGDTACLTTPNAIFVSSRGLQHLKQLIARQK